MGTERSWECIAGAELRTRGWYGSGNICLMSPPLPAEIYPDTQFCGGTGAEQIEQARIISWLGGGPSLLGISANVQWELGLYQNDPAPGDIAGRRRADVVYYDPSDASKPVQVYELKQTSNSSYSDRQAQLDEYEALLSDVVSPANHVSSGTALYGHFDLFLVNSGNPCPDDPELNLLDAYISWQEAPGLYDIYRYQPPCFDYQRVPVPVPNPAQVPNYVNLPQFPSSLFQVPNLLPNTPPPVPPNNPNLLPNPIPAPNNPVNSPVPRPPNGPTGPCTLDPNCYQQNRDYFPRSTGGQSGDPHIVTFDGLHYDMQAVGEFEAAYNDQFGLDVQARLVPIGTHVSAVSALAFSFDGHRFQLNIRGGGDPLLIDGASYSLAAGDMLDFGDGGFVMHTDDGYYVGWPGTGPRPSMWTGYSQFELNVPPGTQTQGLLGNNDGQPDNDLETGFGTALPADASATTLDGTFADSWRLTQDESFFTYADGQSTDTFTDLSFPTSVVTIHDLSSAGVADGTSHCADAGVTDGAQFDDCVVDWELTQDANFVSSAATQVTPMMEGGSSTVDGSGVVSENFDGAVAPNFSAARYGVAPYGGTFAGPFGHDDRYVFYVPELPPHSSATVGFDLVAIGDWTTNASSNTVSVSVNGTVAWTGAVATGTPTSTGTLSNGQPYAVYPVSVTVPDNSSELNVGITAPIGIGSSMAFAIDNVQASFALVAPQTFQISLPVAVADGVPAAGAGNLESTASEDDYTFALASPAPVQVDVSNCSSSLGYWVDWSLVDSSSGATVASKDFSCGSQLIPSVPAGQYRLSVTHSGATGTYNLGITVASAPETYNVTLPASVTSGSPAGAGTLETTSSEDDYAFTTTSDGTLQVDLSNCASSLGYWVNWTLADAQTGATLASKTLSCGSLQVPGLPSGQYKLEVSHNGSTGTYNVGISLVPAPDVFNVTLPVSVSNGVPATGAGNLEVTSSEDDYVFTTTSSGAVQVDLSNCSSSLGYNVNWSLVDLQSGSTVYSKSLTCGSQLVSGVGAGNYMIAVTHNGATGTYNLGILVQPPAQVFNVTPPVSISNGVPSAGAGNLETTASEDDYKFTTTSSNNVQVDVSNCSSSLGYTVNWTLVNAQSGASVYAKTLTCGSQTVNGVPAGQYTLQLTHNGATGTYNLGISLVPAPDVFNVSLPVSVSNGVPAAGAGNLETTSSEDDYLFTTTASGGLQVDVSNCSSSLSYYVNWSLKTQSGTTVYSKSFTCGSQLVTGVAAGQYKIAVTHNGASGTYNLGILVQPPAQLFDVTLPASISNGVPSSGAGNLETTASEDDYRFTTATTGTITVALSSCSSSLSYYVNWSLVNAQTGATVYSKSITCGSQAVSNVAAGQYKVVVTHNGASGTYNLNLSLG